MISPTTHAWLVLQRARAHPHPTTFVREFAASAEDLLDRTRRLDSWRMTSMIAFIFALLLACARGLPWLWTSEPVWPEIVVLIGAVVATGVGTVLVGLARVQLRDALALEVDLLERSLDVLDTPQQILEDHPHLGPWPGGKDVRHG